MTSRRRLDIGGQTSSVEGGGGKGRRGARRQGGREAEEEKHGRSGAEEAIERIRLGCESFAIDDSSCYARAKRRRQERAQGKMDVGEQMPGGAWIGFELNCTAVTIHRSSSEYLSEQTHLASMDYTIRPSKRIQRAYQLTRNPTRLNSPSPDSLRTDSIPLRIS
jgi:hypothetical protein